MERKFCTLFLILIAIQEIDISLCEPFANNDNRSLDFRKTSLEETENNCQTFSSETLKGILNQLKLANEIVKPTSRKIVLVLSKSITEAALLVKYITGNNKRMLKPPSNIQFTEDEKIIQEIFAQYRDTASNTSYYIYPGMNIPNYEILTKYIADMIIRHAERLKIILTLSRSDDSRQPFVDDIKDLINNFKKILPDFPKYQHSTLFAIIGILNDNYPDYEDNEYGSTEIEEINHVISENKFLVYYLANISEAATNEVFRNTIENVLKFAPKQSNNLKFPINKFSKDLGVCLTDEINKDIEVDTKKIKDLIFDYYRQQEEKINKSKLADITDFAYDLQEANRTLSKLDNINGSFRESFNQLFTEIEKLNIRIPANISEIFFKKAKIFDFLKNITGTLNEPKKWISSLKKTVPELYEAEGRESIESDTNANKELSDKVKAILEKSFTANCLVVKHLNLYRLEIRGYVVKTSDIRRHKCPMAQFISLYGLNKIEIDEDIHGEGKSLQVVMIAPKWEVMGKRVINLNGYNASNYEKPASDGGLAKRGKDGKPGLPGGPGGIFLGVGKELRNGKSLQILANGGAGGGGQSGGNGGNGIAGEPPNPDDLKRNSHYLLSSNIRYTKLGHLGSYKEAYCMMYGTNNRPAGNGGNGGMGGYGGKKGEVNIYLKKQKQLIRLAVSDGVEGSKGLGGKGGEGRKHGGNMRGTCRENIVHKDQWVLLTDDRKLKDTKLGPNGKSGLDGSVDGRKASSEAPRFQPNSYFLNEYKSFFREMFTGNMEFYHFLENKTIGEYDVFGFLNELKTLEEQYLKLDVDFLEFYKSLLKRMDNYIRNYELTSNNRKSLNFVYTSTLSKVALLKKGADHSLVIKIREYLEMISKSIEKINLKDYYIKVEKYHQEYNSQIEKKCQEARNLVEEKIMNVVDNLNDELEHRIDVLIQEIIEKKEDLKKTRDEIQDVLINRKWLTALKSVTMLLSFVTFSGPLVGIMVSTAFDVVDPFIVGEKNYTSDVEIPEAAQNSYKKATDNLEIWKKTELRNLDYQIIYIKNRMKDIYNSQNSNSSLLNDVIKLLENNKKAIENGNIFGNNLQGMKKIVQEMNEKAGESSVFEKELNVIISFQTLASLNFTAYGFDVIKEDKEKFKEMKDAFHIANANIENLRQHEESIHKVLSPVLEKMKRDLPTGKTLTSKSFASLEVTKWEVQTTLRTTKKILADSTKGFSVESNVKLFLDNLDVAMTTAINLYEKIENYQDEKKLADYIKHISSPAFASIRAQEGSLGTHVIEVQKMIEHNLVLVQYKKAIEALKMIVFPFAEKYFKNIKLPRALEMSVKNDSELLEDVARTIENWKTDLDERKYMISVEDLFRETLDVNNRYEELVYYWKNCENRKMISDLLDGKEVTLFPTPNASRFKHDAVKFTNIAIGFKSANKSLQEEIQQKLNSSLVTMVHQGNSYFKCGVKIYVISHSSLTLRMKFGQTGSNYPAIQISSGDAMLSPFAMWKVKISSHTDEKFVDLSAYKNDVDVIFVGEFEYVLDDSEVCKHDLSEYYEEYVPIVYKGLDNNNCK